MKIRVETASLMAPNISGVGHYTRLLVNGLAKYSPANTELSVVYFNFLNKHSFHAVNPKVKHERHILVPQRVFSKLQSFGLPIPFDLFSRSVDVTIFPNYDHWFTIKSKLTATVIHDLCFLRHPDVVEERNLAHLKRVVGRSIKRSDFIITVSDAVRQEIIKEFSISEDRVITTPIPPDPIYFRPGPLNSVAKKYKLPTEKYILFVGNLEPRKDLPTLIAAYRKLPIELRKQYSLVLVGGKGWRSEKTEVAIKDAIEAGEHVIRPGYIPQPEMPSFYQQASLVCLPSIYEGFGMQITEALASNTPMLVSDIPVFREVGGKSARYANVGDVDDFSNKILQVLKSPKSKQVNTEAYNRQLAKISWQRNVEKLLNTFTKSLWDK